MTEQKQAADKITDKAVEKVADRAVENEAASPVQRLEKQILAQTDGSLAIDLLAADTPLSKQKLKQAMAKGGVWLKKARGGRRRLRRAKTELEQGDIIELHYDTYILDSTVSPPTLVADKKRYSVWYKPENMLSQGSKFADHCAITRWVEKNHQPKRAVYLVHRLDRAASGLMLLAHDQQTAAKLSKLFSTRNIKKRYEVSVAGQFDASLPLQLDTPLDGKNAESVVLEAKSVGAVTELLVEIKTGRKHQIRRHLSEKGWPVLGDKIYGDHQQKGALMLRANYLAFVCPLSNAPVSFVLPADLPSDLPVDGIREATD